MCRRRRLLDHDQTKRILLGVLNEQLGGLHAHCLGFVVMPDHVHAMVWFRRAGELSRFMHGWKRISSFRIRQWYRSQSARYLESSGEGDRFGQPKDYSFEIYGRGKLVEKI